MNASMSSPGLKLAARKRRSRKKSCLAVGRDASGKVRPKSCYFDNIEDYHSLPVHAQAVNHLTHVSTSANPLTRLDVLHPEATVVRVQKL